MFTCLLSELDEEYKEKWEAFVLGSLAELNQKNTIELVSFPVHKCCKN